MYYRLATPAAIDRGRPLDPEGFAVISCDTAGCSAAVAVAFVEADSYPRKLATDAAVAAGWALLGADDRCPAHRAAGVEVGTTVEINAWLTGTVTELGPVQATVKGANGRTYRIERAHLVEADNANVRL